MIGTECDLNERVGADHEGEASEALRSDVPVSLIGQAAAWFELVRDASSVIVRPRQPLPRRCTIRPAALFHQERGFPDVSTVMGRLCFANGTTDEQCYTPFTRDPQRRLRELFLPVEAMPDDDWQVSTARCTNFQAIARRLLAAAEVPWKGLTPAEIEEFVAYVPCPEPIESFVLHALAQWTNGRGSCVIEIGSFRGRSISALAIGLRGVGSDAKIISVDPHLDQPSNREHVRTALAQLGEARRLVQFVGGSDEAARVLRPGCASLIFIDGDHSYRQVISDFENYRDLLAPGGCMVFHDYGFGAHTGQGDAQPDVRRAVDERVFDAPGFRPLLLAQVLLAFVKPGD
jgi:predicted O-methyltransferase YrrM